MNFNIQTQLWAERKATDIVLGLKHIVQLAI